MKSFLLLLALGLATSDKLDRTYLPPPGSKQAGGSPGAIQVPFEYPKESYQTTRRPFVNAPDYSEFYQDDNMQINKGNDQPINESYDPISRVSSDYPQQPFSFPTTTTSYAFTQTTTFPPNEGFETTVTPFLQFVNASTSNQAPTAYENEPSAQVFQNDQLIDPNSAFVYPRNREPESIQTNKNNFNTDISQKRPIVYQSQPHSENMYIAQQPNYQRPGLGSQVLPNENQFNNPSAAQTPGNFNNQNSFSSSFPSQFPSSSQTDSASNLYQNQDDNLKYPSPSDSSNNFFETRNSYPALINDNIQPDYPITTSNSLSSTYTTPSDNDLTTAIPFEKLDQQNGLPNKSIHHPERPRGELDRNAVILSYENIMTPEGYAYSYDTSNGIHVDESASTVNGVKAQGSFSYIGDDGKEYSVIYTADENGFQPRGDHLPTPPPIPEAIQRVIEQAARDKEAGITDDGSYDESKYGHKNYESSRKKALQEPLKNVPLSGNAGFENNAQDSFESRSPSNHLPVVPVPAILNDNKISELNGVSGQNPVDLNRYSPLRDGFRSQNENIYGAHQNGYLGDSAEQMTKKGYPTQDTDVSDKTTNNLEIVAKSENDQNRMYPGKITKQASPSQVKSVPVVVLPMGVSNTGVSSSPIMSFSKKNSNQQQNLPYTVQKSQNQNGDSFTTAMPPNERFASNTEQSRQPNLRQPSDATKFEQKPINEAPSVNTTPDISQGQFNPSMVASNLFDKFKISEVSPYNNKQQDLSNSNRFENKNELRFPRPDSTRGQNLPAKSAENNINRDIINYGDISPNVNGGVTTFGTYNDGNNDFTKPSEGYHYFPPQQQFIQGKVDTFPSQASFGMKKADFIVPSSDFTEKKLNNQRPSEIQKPARNTNDFNDKDYEYLEDDEQGKPYSSIKSTMNTPAITTIKPVLASTFQPRGPTTVLQNNKNQLSGNTRYPNKTNTSYVPSMKSFPSRFGTKAPIESTKISSQYSSTTPIPRPNYATSSPSPVFISKGSDLPPRNKLRKPQTKVPTSTYRPQYDQKYVSTPKFGMKILPVKQMVNQFAQVNINNGIPTSNQINLASAPTQASFQLPQTARPSNGLNSSSRRPIGSVSQPDENVRVYSNDEIAPHQVIGEDFSGPKQPQRFDPDTGYHYK